MAKVVEGMRSVRHRIRIRRKMYDKAVRKAAKEAGEFLLEKTLPFVPVDTGRLRESGEVKVSGKVGDVSAWVQFLAPYAIFVHENMQAQHAPPTTAKFLEIAAIQYQDEVRTIIRIEAHRNL
jgi:hypothetical protein